MEQWARGALAAAIQCEERGRPEEAFSHYLDCLLRTCAEPRISEMCIQRIRAIHASATANSTGSTAGRARSPQAMSSLLEATRRSHEQELLRRLAPSIPAAGKKVAPQGGILDRLLASRRSFSARINDAVSEYIRTHFVRTIEADLDAVRETLAEELRQTKSLLRPLRALLLSGANPIGAITADFLRRQRHLVLNQQSPLQVLQEFRLFEHHLYTLLAVSEQTESDLRMGLQTVLLHETPLGPSLARQLARTLPKSVDLESATIRLAFAPDLGTALECKAPSTSVPVSCGGSLYDKLDAMLACCDVLSHPDQSGDELMRAVACQLVRQQSPLLYADVYVLEQLCPLGMLRGQAGYVLATVAAAVEFVIACASEQPAK